MKDQHEADLRAHFIHILQAYWEAEQDAEEKARIKRDERVIKHWTRLIHGLRIRQRLQAQYAPKPEVHSQDGGHKTDRQPGTSKDIIVTMSHPGVGAGGGFLVGADDVVQPFHLPKAKYQPLEEATATGSPNQGDQAGFPERVRAEESMIFSPGPNDGTYNLGTLGEDSDVDMELEEVIISKPQLREQNGRGAAPKTMQELAEDLARRNNTEDDDYDEYIDTNALGTSSSARGPGEHGVIQSNSSPRSLRVTLKLPNNPATSSGTSTPGGKDVASRRTSARLPRKAKPKKRARDDDTDYETDEDISPPTPKKRATKMAENLPAPTRTLRPRASKSAAQMKEAEEQEEAYRRAIER
ncbi:hypothetical protein H0H87_006512 [Tephrocybe sp. NHM501043]|nr:hypothetical protein H0H87_006512 [Tephrocybe sp. NHM501043]